MTPELLTEVVSFIASQFTTQALHSHLLPVYDWDLFPYPGYCQRADRQFSFIGSVH